MEDTITIRREPERMYLEQDHWPTTLKVSLALLQMSNKDHLEVGFSTITFWLEDRAAKYWVTEFAPNEGCLLLNLDYVVKGAS